MKSIIPSSEDHNEEATSISVNNSHMELDLKEVFDNSPVAFCVTDGKGRLKFFNQAAARLFGRQPEIGSDMLFRTWKLYYSDGTPMPVEECPMARCISEGVPFENFRMAVEGTTGGIVHLLVFSKPILDDQGKVSGAHHTMVDVTEQRTTDLKQETLSAIVESSDDAVVSKDLDGIILSWNKGAEKIFGFTEAEMLGKPMKLIIPENRRADEAMLLEKIREGKAVHHYETIRRHKNGQEVPVSLAISPIKDNKGVIIGASKVARDISERLRGEEKQAVLSAIVESSGDAIISKNLNGIILSWNKGAEQIFGYTEAEAVGKPVTLLIPEDRYEEENHILEKVRSGGKVDHFETVRVHKSGMKLYIALTVSPIRDNSGRIVGASKIARDISAQVKAKQEIARHTRNLEILNALGKSMSRKMDVQAVVQQVATATTQLSGAEMGVFLYKVTSEEGEEAYEIAAVSGLLPNDFKTSLKKRFIEYFEPVMEAAVVIRTHDVNEDDRFHSELSNLLSQNFGLRSVLAVPVVTASGTVIGGLLLGHPSPKSFSVEQEDLVTNISAQAAISIDNSKLFEQVKALSDKKDEFIALASHELRTPLTTINGYLQMLGKMEKDQMSELFLNKSLYQVRKLNTLVEDLLNMSRIEAGKLDFNTEDFDLCPFLKDITETFAYTSKTHKLICEVPAHSVMVHADRQRIEQAVNNLLSNAVKYSPKADKVYVSLKVDGGKAEVSIKDEGIGMTTEQQKKLFSRFYRAENQKGISGLGLGLYLTKQIIDRHQGCINLISDSGRGSEFTIVLPIVEK